jgi:hypothetical protein
MKLIALCVLILAVSKLIQAHRDKKLLETNPEAWRAKKAHEEERKARKWGMTGRAGFEVFKWWWGR